MNANNSHTPDLSGFDEVVTMIREPEMRERLANGWELITFYMGINSTSGAQFPIYMMGRTAVFEFTEETNPDDATSTSRDGWQSLGVFSRKLYDDNSGGGYAYAFRRRRKPKAA